MPDKDSNTATPDLKHLTARQPISVKELADDEAWARELAHNMTHRSSSVNPYTAPAYLPRALTVPEAQRRARDLAIEGHHSAVRSLDRCWDRLPNAERPEERLSFERLITALTEVITHLDWENGQIITAEICAERKRNDVAIREEEALARWRDHSAPVF